MSANPDTEPRVTLPECTISRLKDDNQRTVYRVSLSSETPIVDWPGAPPNVLVHEERAIDLSAVGKNGLPLYDSHKFAEGVDRMLGRVKNVRLENRRLVGELVFSRSNPKAQLAREMVDDGTLSDMSLTAGAIKVERVERNGELQHYKWTRWRPVEASIVGIGADQSVGIGRSFQNQGVDDLDEEEDDMSQQASRPVMVERHRNTFIMEDGAKNNCAALALHAVSNGWSVTEYEAVRNERRAAGVVDGEFRVSRMLESLADKTPVDGFEREYLEEQARREGRLYDGACTVPFRELVTRDLNLANAGQGGFLGGTEVLPVEFMLRPVSKLIRAGVLVIPNVTAAQTLPIVHDDNITVTWQSDETTAGSGSTPILRQASGSAKVGIGLIQFSRRFSKQVEDPETFARQLLARVAGRIIDGAILNGSGVSGQPMGVPSWAGVGAVAGASLDFSDVVGMKADAASAGADDSNIAFFGHPGVRELLELRERAAATGNGFIWDSDRVASVPAYATTDVASGGLLCGPWSSVAVLLFGSGVTIELDQYGTSANFTKGIISARVMIDMDTLVAHPDAFTYASSVT